MANVLDDSQGGTGERPTFLTVLCILTFIGSPLALIGNIMNYMSMTGEMAGMALAMLEAMGITINPIGYLISAVLCLGSLFGGIMMWKLKKTGYYIYVGATVATLVIQFVMLGGLALGGLAILSVALAALFPILYGLNLKHMS